MLWRLFELEERDKARDLLTDCITWVIQCGFTGLRSCRSTEIVDGRRGAFFKINGDMANMLLLQINFIVPSAAEGVCLSLRCPKAVIDPIDAAMTKLKKLFTCYPQTSKAAWKEMLDSIKFSITWDKYFWIFIDDKGAQVAVLDPASTQVADEVPETPFKNFPSFPAPQEGGDYRLW